jgi:hypothetical protein
MARPCLVIVELCGVDVGTELFEDWVPFWVGDLGKWGLGCLPGRFLQLVSDGLVGEAGKPIHVIYPHHP